MLSPGADFFQSCWVVQDLHLAMRKWHETTGIGPFFFLENQRPDDYHYCGVAAAAPLFGVAFAYTGKTQIELIVQHDDAPSAYTKTFGRHGAGHHHLGADVTDYDRRLEAYRALGLEVTQEATFGGQRYCYVDTREALGFMTELFEWNSDSKAFMADVARIAASWDGQDPYRSMN